MAAYVWDEAELARLALQAEHSWRAIAPALEQAGLQPGITAVDAGCGTGMLTRQLAAAVGPQGAVIGVDADADLLTRAAAAPPPADAAPVRWAHGDARDLPLDDASADLILVHLVLQHVPDPGRVLEACRRVLRAGGAVVLVDVDDDLLSFTPAVPDLDALVDETIRLHAARGGDRKVGRRLAGLAHAAGLEVADLRVQVWTSPPQPVDLFFPAAVGFRVQAFPPEAQAAAAARIEAAKAAFTAAERPFAQVGLYVVTARRP